MGFSLSWAAVRGKAPSVVLDQLGVRRSGERQDVAEAPLVAAQLPDSWYLIVGNDDERLLQEAVLQRLSSGCEVVMCFVEEHVMFSAASGWTNGTIRWRVEHDSEQGLEHLDVQGELPQSFAAIEARLRHKLEQAGDGACDFLFDVPVELAKDRTGFRHDEVRNEIVFDVLTTAAP